MFEVGSFYKIKDDPPSNMPSHHWSARGIVMECIKTFGSRYGVLSGAKEVTWHIDWVERISAPAEDAKESISTCKCDLFSSGCTCGEMTKAMDTRGLVKCKHTKLWIPKS